MIRYYPQRVTYRHEYIPLFVKWHDPRNFGTAFLWCVRGRVNWRNE